MKQWQNFQALGKVKTCIEQQVREVATILENSLDKDEGVLLSADENFLCVCRASGELPAFCT